MPEVSLNNLPRLRPGAAHRYHAALAAKAISIRIGTPMLGGPDNLLSGWPKATGGDPKASPDLSSRGSSRDLLRTARARTTSCPGHRSASAGLLIFCLAISTLAGVRAENVDALPALRPQSQSTPSVPLVDPQDRIMPGHLSPDAESRTRANALYAEAMCDDPDGNLQKTLSQLRQVAALDPHFANAQVKIGNLLLQSGRFDEALAQLKAASAANPDSIAVEVALAYAERLRGQNEDALRLAKDALTRDSGQSVAMRVLLEIAGDQDDLAGAVLHIEDIFKAGGSSVPAASWLTLARLYMEVARGDRVPPSGEVILRTRLPILQQAAAKSPPDLESLTLLADTYRDLGRRYDALQTLHQALALEPSNVDLLMDCADLEADLGENKGAIQHYETAYALNPGLTGLREMLGRFYLNDGRFEQAATLFEEALVDSPHDPGLEIALGIAYEGSHRPQQAQSCFRQVFSSVSCPPEAYLKLAFFQLAHKEVSQAGETLAAARIHFPHSAQIRFYEAIQHRYEKNYDAALTCLAEVRTLATGRDADVLDPAFYLENALTLNLAGHQNRLEAVLHEGLDKFPNNPELMNELAYFWADQGQHLPEALALSRRAARLDPDNGPILDTWGWVYFQMGQVKDALPYLQRAAVMTNNDPVVLQHVGDAYLKLGLRREALAAWYHALEKDPRNGDLANRIDAALAQAKNAHSRPAPRP